MLAELRSIWAGAGQLSLSRFVVQIPVLSVFLSVVVGCSPDADPEKLSATGNTAGIEAEFIDADWRPPLGETWHAPAQAHRGIARLFLALSDSPKRREFRECVCRNELLTVSQAQYLARHADRLALSYLTTLDVIVARELAACSYLECPALNSISPDAAHELAAVSAALKLQGLDRLDAPTARVLATQRGHLSLAGLSELEPGVAEALAKHEGSLNLDGLETAEAEDLAALARHVGPVNLASLPAETPGLAEAFAGFRYPFTVKSTPEVAPPSGRQREEQP